MRPSNGSVYATCDSAANGNIHSAGSLRLSVPFCGTSSGWQASLNAAIPSGNAGNELSEAARKRPASSRSGEEDKSCSNKSIQKKCLEKQVSLYTIAPQNHSFHKIMGRLYIKNVFLRIRVLNQISDTFQTQTLFPWNQTQLPSEYATV